MIFCLNLDADLLELSGKFGGDMVLNNDQMQLYFNKNKISARSGINIAWYKWPDNTIPYVLSDKFCNYHFNFNQELPHI